MTDSSNSNLWVVVKVHSGIPISAEIFEDESKAWELEKQLREEIRKTKADSIFVPFFLDYNFDHQITNYALAEALGGLTRKPRVYGYEVWGLCIPNVILIIDSVMEEKQKFLFQLIEMQFPLIRAWGRATITN